MPRRRPNAEIRTREHLTSTEVAKLIKAAGKNRWGDRDATMILVAYRHGLRVSELVDLRIVLFEMLWGGGEEIVSIVADMTDGDPQCKSRTT